MKINLDEKRKTTMRNLLGDACQFIDDEKFLPMFRNRQIHYPEEFEQSVRLAKKIKLGANKYFAKIWSVKNLKGTLAILRKMINRALSKKAKLRHEIAQKKRISIAQRNTNSNLREKYIKMRNEKFARSKLNFA